MKQLNNDQRRLVNENMKLAEQWAWKFGSVILGDNTEKSITMDDLIQEAAIGLCEAASRYDPALGVDFGTLAFYWCRKCVLRAVRKFGTPLSVPCNFSDTVSVVHFDTKMQDLSIAYADCDDKGSPGDRLSYEICMGRHTEEEAQWEQHRAVKQALDTLTETERMVITWTFGLNGETLRIETIASLLGIVPGRVTQIKQKAMGKIERSLTSSKSRTVAFG